MKKWGSLDVAGRAGQHRKPAAARIGCPTKQRSRNQNGCAARSADKNVGVAGLEARSTRAVKSSRAAKNSKGCNTERRSRNQKVFPKPGGRKKPFPVLTHWATICRPSGARVTAESSRAAKNSKGCNTERRSRNQTIEGCVMANCCQ